MKFSFVKMASKWKAGLFSRFHHSKWFAMAGGLAAAPLGAVDAQTIAEEKAKKATDRTAKQALQHGEFNPAFVQVPRPPQQTTRPSIFMGDQQKEQGMSLFSKASVGLGLVATVGALMFMMFSSRQGNHKAMVRGAQYRIMAQAMTFMFCIIALGSFARKHKRERESLEAHQQRMEAAKALELEGK